MIASVHVNEITGNKKIQTLENFRRCVVCMFRFAVVPKECWWERDM